MKAVRFLWLILFLGISGYSFSVQKLIPPCSPDIYTLGRVDKSDPDRYVFDYPGVSFKMNFSSTSIAVKLKGGQENYFDIWIDNVLQPKIYAQTDTVLVLSRSLSKKKPHTILLYKRTEALHGSPSSFSGFLIDKEGTSLPPNFKKERKILFIGNSITVGYGTESLTASEKFAPQTENNYKSYASILARAFDADYHIVAHSGRGVVRNYGDKNKVSDVAMVMPTLFEQTLDGNPNLKWNHTDFSPQIIFVNLGTNDYSTNPFPDKEYFVEKYLEFLQRLHSIYGQRVPIVCLVGPLADEPLFSIVKEIVNKYQEQNPTHNTHFQGISRATLKNPDDYGAWHPNYEGQKKMARVIIPITELLMDWKANMVD